MDIYVDNLQNQPAKMIMYMPQMKLQNQPTSMKETVKIWATPTQMFTDTAVTAVPSLLEKRIRLPHSMDIPLIIVPVERGRGVKEAGFEVSGALG